MPPFRRPSSVLPLPPPTLPEAPLGEVMRARRSAEDFGDPISLRQLSTLLYLTVGITGWTYAYGGRWPLRAYPSAGALQPVEAYPLALAVEGLEPGVYRYDPFSHGLESIRRGLTGGEVADIALGQDHVGRAAAVLALTVYYARTRWKYRQRALLYALLDAGAAMENAYLAATAMGLSVRAIGAFYDEELCGLLQVDCRHEFPAVLVAVGR